MAKVFLMHMRSLLKCTDHCLWVHECVCAFMFVLGIQRDGQQSGTVCVVLEYQIETITDSTSSSIMIFLSATDLHLEEIVYIFHKLRCTHFSIFPKFIFWKEKQVINSI